MGDSVCTCCLKCKATEHCDTCGKKWHAECYPSKGRCEWCAYSVTSANGSASALAKRKKGAKTQWEMDCQLCTVNQVETALRRTDKGKWVHAVCALGNRVGEVCVDGATVVTLDGGEWKEVMCELCGGADGVGVVTCAGECGTSFFHPMCALARGFASGYSAKRCPKCECEERMKEIRERVAKVLVTDDGAGTVVERLKIGEFDRSPFLSALEFVKQVESKSDKRLLQGLKLLASTPIKPSKDEVAELVKYSQRLNQGKPFTGALLKVYREIVSSELESEILSNATQIEGRGENAQRLPKTSAEVQRVQTEKRVMFGLRDSASFYLDAQKVISAVLDVFGSGEDGTRACQAVIREVVRVVEQTDENYKAEVAEREQFQKNIFADEETTVTTTNPTLDVGPFLKGPSNRKKPFGSSSKGSSSSGTDSGKKSSQGSKSQAQEETPFGESLGKVGSLPSHSTFLRMNKIRHALDENAQTEPYLGGTWNKAPYPKRPYDQIDHYLPADGLSKEQQAELLRILNSKKEPNCSMNSACEAHVQYSLFNNTFDTDLPCKSRRVGCPASSVGKGERLNLGEDLSESNTWGFDCYTRKNITSVLDIVCGVDNERSQRRFLQHLLLPVVTIQPSFRAHNLMYALRSILRVCGLPPPSTQADPEKKKDAEFNGLYGEFVSDYSQDDSPQVVEQTKIILSHLSNMKDDILTIDKVREICAALLFALRNWGLSPFRAHPKGVGVTCKRGSGLKSGTFVTEYFGELYPCWRWFEKTDAIKNVQKAVNFKPILPDFYNMQVERHNDDEDGYDIAYVDPTVRGNYASRLSHSCEPNCATVVMVVNHKYVVSLYTLRDISYGEELTFDYSSVTEDESEFRAATCLCGSLQCRGSFLYYAGSGAFAEVLNDFHQFNDRNAIIFRACADPKLSNLESDRLVRHGLKSAVLQGMPAWMKKWASLVLAYAEFEQEELTHRLSLLVHPHGGLLYNSTSARIEAKGVADNRKQNVVITLNKLRYFLSAKREGKQGKEELPGPIEAASPPMNVLSENEICNYLWNRSESIAAIGLDRALKTCRPEDKEKFQALEKSRSSETLTDLKLVRCRLRELRDLFWSLKPSNTSVGFVAAGDLLTWHMYTDNYFSSNSYNGVRSPPVIVRNVDIGKDGSVFEAVRGGSSKAAASADSKKANGRAKTSTSSGRGKKSRKDEDGVSTFTEPECSETNLNESRPLESSTRVPGPFLLPFWFDEGSNGDGMVSLSNCSEESMAELRVMQSESSDQFCQSFGLTPMKSSKMEVEEESSKVGSCMTYIVFHTPMPGAVPLYLFKSRADQAKTIFRVVPDQPLRPVRDSDIQWALVGLFYAFDVALPGTAKITALDHSGKLFDFYAFPKPYFSANVRFSANPSSMIRRTARKGKSSLPKAVDPLAPVFPVDSKDKAKLFTKKYMSGFVWGQMCGWFKQTVASPDASLSAERRGTLSLPDIESCFGGSKYSDRKLILERIENSPSVMWPTGTHWSFKNKQKIYGSPWFDTAVDPTSLNCFNVIREVRFHMAKGIPPK